MLLPHKEYLKQLRIILGSQSQGRRNLLKLLDLFNFDICPSDFQENLDKNMEPIEYVKQTCLGKVDDLIPKLQEWDICIFADTVCEIQGQIIEKAQSKEEAANFLRKFSDSKHQVHTCVCIVGRTKGKEIKKVYGIETSEVHFIKLNEEIIQAYVNDESLWKGRAGGYAVQNQGNLLIKKIDGDYSNVLGLPLVRMSELMVEIINFIKKN